MNPQLKIPHETPIHGQTNLPQRAPGDELVGRESDQSALHVALKAATAALIQGPPGVGKSALAASVASGFAELPGGVLWLPQRNDSLRSLLSRVARAYGFSAAAWGDLDAQVSAAAALLREHRPLVVLDGVVNEDAARDFVRRCAPGLPLLLVNAARLSGPWTPQPIQPLGGHDAEALLWSMAGNTTEAGSPELVQLRDALAGMPLGIVLSARQMAAHKLDAGAYLERLGPLPDAPGARVMAVVAGAFRMIPSALQKLLLLLGSAPSGAASVDLLADVGGAPAEAVRNAMHQLDRLGFIHVHGQDDTAVFVVHPLVQRFVEAFLRGKKQQDAMNERYRKGLQIYLGRYAAQPEQAAYQKLAVEMPNILAAGIGAVQTGDADFARQLLDQLAPGGPDSFINAAGFQAEYDWLRDVIAAPDLIEHGLLGREEEVAADDAEAEDKAAVAVEEQAEELAPAPAPASIMPEAASESPTLAESAPTATTPETPIAAETTVTPTGDPVADEAISATARELESYQADGNVDDELAALQSLAALHLERADYGDVLQYVERGLALAQDNDHPSQEGQMLIVLGDLQHMLGSLKGAEEAYKEAVKALRPAEAWHDIALTLEKLGSIYDEQNRLPEAIAIWEQALPILERENERARLIDILNRLGDLNADMLKWEPSEQYYTRALSMVREDDDHQGMFDQYLDLGYLFESKGDHEAAKRNFLLALDMAFKLEDGGKGAAQLGETMLALAQLLVGDTAQLNRVVQLLEGAQERLPDDKVVQRLLKRAKTRQERLAATDVDLGAADDSLEAYAQAAVAQLDQQPKG